MIDRVYAVVDLSENKILNVKLSLGAAKTSLHSYKGYAKWENKHIAVQEILLGNVLSSHTVTGKGWGDSPYVWTKK